MRMKRRRDVRTIAAMSRQVALWYLGWWPDTVVVAADGSVVETRWGVDTSQPTPSASFWPVGGISAREIPESMAANRIFQGRKHSKNKRWFSNIKKKAFRGSFGHFKKERPRFPWAWKFPTEISTIRSDRTERSLRETAVPAFVVSVGSPLSLSLSHPTGSRPRHRWWWGDLCVCMCVCVCVCGRAEPTRLWVTRRSRPSFPWAVAQIYGRPGTLR